MSEKLKARDRMIEDYMKGKIGVGEMVEATMGRRGINLREAAERANLERLKRVIEEFGGEDSC